MAFITAKFDNQSETTFQTESIINLSKELNTDGSFTYYVVIAGFPAPVFLKPKVYNKLLKALKPETIEIDKPEVVVKPEDNTKKPEVSVVT